ncbi:MAG: hypothetical protein KAZ88_01150 [Acidimicrobiia bacterium]|nr:hypothetical protein [Acidimicrobiia bacterium]MBP8179582.1 hypothetical protein [Acidimicrobiia bacterium]
MASLLECPKCGRRHRQAEVPGGDTFACLRCGARLKVPVAWRDPEETAAQAASGPEPKQRARRFRRGRRGGDGADQAAGGESSNQQRPDAASRGPRQGRRSGQVSDSADSALEDDLTRTLEQWDDDTLNAWSSDLEDLFEEGADAEAQPAADSSPDDVTSPDDSVPVDTPDGGVKTDGGTPASTSAPTSAGSGRRGPAGSATRSTPDAHQPGAAASPGTFNPLDALLDLGGADLSGSLRIGADAIGPTGGWPRPARSGPPEVEPEFDEDAARPGRYSNIADAPRRQGSRSSAWPDSEETPAEAEVTSGEFGGLFDSGPAPADPVEDANDDTDDADGADDSGDLDESGFDFADFGLDDIEEELDNLVGGQHDQLEVGDEGEDDPQWPHSEDDGPASHSEASADTAGALADADGEPTRSLESLYELPSDAFGSEFFEDDEEEEESRSDRLDGFFGDRKKGRSRFGRLGRRSRSADDSLESGEEEGDSSAGSPDDEDSWDDDSFTSGEERSAHIDALMGLDDVGSADTENIGDFGGGIDDDASIDEEEDLGDAGDLPTSTDSSISEIDLLTGIRAVRVLDEEAASAATTNIDPTVVFDATTRPQPARKRKPGTRQVVPDASIPLVKDRSGGLVPFEPVAAPLPDRRRRRSDPDRDDSGRRPVDGPDRPNRRGDLDRSGDDRRSSSAAERPDRRPTSRSRSDAEESTGSFDDGRRRPRERSSTSSSGRAEPRRRDPGRRDIDNRGGASRDPQRAPRMPRSAFERAENAPDDASGGLYRPASDRTREVAASGELYRPPADSTRADVPGARSLGPERGTRPVPGRPGGPAGLSATQTRHGYTRPIGADNDQRVTQMLADAQRHRRPVRIPRQASPRVVTAVVWSASVIGALLIIVFATWILGSVLGLAGASVFKESSVREIILGTDRDRFVSPLLFAVLWAVVAGSIAHVLLSRARRG